MFAPIMAKPTVTATAQRARAPASGKRASTHLLSSTSGCIWVPSKTSLACRPSRVRLALRRASGLLGKAIRHLILHRGCRRRAAARRVSEPFSDTVGHTPIRVRGRGPSTPGEWPPSNTRKADAGKPRRRAPATAPARAQRRSRSPDTPRTDRDPSHPVTPRIKKAIHT